MKAELPRMVRVSRERPCKICGRFDWCLSDPRGMTAICKRVESPRVLKNDAGWLHRLDEPIPPFTPPPPRERRKAVEWFQIAKNYAACLDPAEKGKLAVSLGLPPDGLNSLPMTGWRVEPDGVGCYTFPEFDGSGAIVGIKRRFLTGHKKTILGGKPGLTLPDGWDEDVSDPIYVVEGPTDAAAMVCAGLKAIGRPSNRGGVDYLNECLKEINPQRTVIVVGENDQKDDGLWPGLEGAIAVAGALKQHRDRILWAILPPEYKDVREFLTSEMCSGHDWAARGAIFEQTLMDPVDAVYCPDGYKPVIDRYKRELAFEPGKWQY